MDINLIRKHLNKVANIVKMVEELDPQAVILPNIVRSVQLDPYSCGLQSVYNDSELLPESALTGEART